MGKKRIRQQYYLDPFSDHKDPALKITKDKYELKTNCVVLARPLVENGLRDIPSDATLIIDGHGTSEDHTTISAESKPGEFILIPVNKLADMIAYYWRLPQEHVKIRMLSCWGYGFARLLALSLGKKEHPKIHVAGYKGLTKTGVYEPGTGRGPNPVEIEGEDSWEKSRIEWYDTAGNLVSKPDVGDTAFVGESDSKWN
jgi:hypothetical protein